MCCLHISSVLHLEKPRGSRSLPLRFGSTTLADLRVCPVHYNSSIWFKSKLDLGYYTVSRGKIKWDKRVVAMEEGKGKVIDGGRQPWCKRVKTKSLVVECHYGCRGHRQGWQWCLTMEEMRGFGLNGKRCELGF